MTEWTVDAYIKVIGVDLDLLDEAFEDVATSKDPTTRRFAVGEALRYTGKIKDNLILLLSAINRKQMELDLEANRSGSTE